VSDSGCDLRIAPFALSRSWRIFAAARHAMVSEQLCMRDGGAYTIQMYLMYVDESGDPGLVGSPKNYFALSGLVIHESRWRDFVAQMKAFRNTMRTAHGLPVRTEIHASDYIKKAPIKRMAPHVRLAVLRNLIDELAKMNFVSVTNVIVDKATKSAPYDVFENAWRTLFQRFENTLNAGNFPGAHRTDQGLILTDNTNGRKLQLIVRKMAVYNMIPNQPQYGSGSRNIPLLKIIEDPHPKDSKDSYFIQACDVCAYFLMQEFQPNMFIRKSGAQHYLHRLGPVLNRKASPRHPFGIVML
jgi:hypothetical protein